MSDNRRSKFMLACNDGTLKEVRSLLRGRVNINRLDVYGETSLIIAARRGNLKIVEAILRKKTQTQYPLRAWPDGPYVGLLDGSLEDRSCAP